MKTYKYFSSDVLNLVFAREGFCGVKCSLPKDYNDPFELFLGVDMSVSPECMATYREIVNDLPQFPTTCFSKSPIVPPMWAHYAQNHSGFVLEFDAEKIKDHFKNSTLGDIEYKNKPNPELKSHLEYATGTRKPRHAYFLRGIAQHEGYFSKYTEWSYEQECRLVAGSNDVENIAGNAILFIPNSCVTAMIVGTKIPSDQGAIAATIAKQNKLDLYELRIGKSFPRPFLVNTDQQTCVFENGEVIVADNACTGCAEPLQTDGELCAWCSITDDHATAAAQGNMFRAMERLGTLDDYMDEMARIGGRRET